MKNLFLFLLLFQATAGTHLHAQGLPAYVYDTTQQTIDTIIPSPRPFDDINIYQSIYYKSDFPAMPAQGFISEIFMKLAYATPSGSTLQGLKVKMGITSMNTYPPSFADPDLIAMDATLDTVYYDSLYTLPVTLPAGSWWRLTLPQPYPYSLLPLPGDTPQNLVVQLSQAVYKTGNFTYKFHIHNILYNSPNIIKCVLASTLGGYLHMAAPVGNGVQLIGFNGYALSVDDPGKIKPFSVFPNPASDKLGFEGEVKGRYKIYNLSGKKLLEGSLQQDRFIDVGSLAAGMYVLETQSGRLKFIKQ